MGSRRWGRKNESEEQSVFWSPQRLGLGLFGLEDDGSLFFLWMGARVFLCVIWFFKKVFFFLLFFPLFFFCGCDLVKNFVFFPSIPWSPNNLNFLWSFIFTFDPFAFLLYFDFFYYYFF